MSFHLFGVTLALLSALLFGGGDFSGGFATRRGRPFQVLAWSALAGAIGLGLLAWLLREPWPVRRDALWAAGAGLSGALGLVALYRGLSRGSTALVSPLAGVVGAALPVIAGALSEGLPETPQMLGFGCALFGIGLVTRAPGTATLPSGPAAVPRGQAALGVASGIGFGGFFILLAQIAPGAVVAPLAIAKVTAVCVAWGITLLGERRAPVLRGSGIAWLSGLLDAAANACYLLARQHTRLDVAVVLSSLYPAFTVLLASLLLRERVSRGQWAGVGLCSAAIALIAI